MADITPKNNSDNANFERRARSIQHLWFQNELEFSEALEQLEVLRQESISENNKINEATIYKLLGIIYGYRGDYATTIKKFKASRQIHEDLGSLAGVADLDLDLGKAYRLLGNFTRAKDYFRNAYEFGDSVEDTKIQGFALANEGQIWLSLKDYKKARQTLEQTLTITEPEWELGTASIIRADILCETHYALVEIELVENNMTGAWEHAVKSLKYAKESRRIIRMGYANRALADVITLLDEVPDSDYKNDPDYYYDQAFKSFEEVKAEGEVAETLFSQGKSLAKRGKKRSAGNILQQAMMIFTRLGMLDSAAEVGNEQMKII